MKTQYSIFGVVRGIAAASLLVCVGVGVFAQEAGKEASDRRKNEPAASARSPQYDLEIKNGVLVWNGAKRKDNANGVEATLDNIIDLLREQHPDVNFVVAAGLGGSISVADLKLRSLGVEEELEALRVACGAKFLWRDIRPSPTVDPQTGLPVAHDNNGRQPVYALTELPGTPKPSLQVEVFNLGGFIGGVASNEGNDTAQKRIQSQVSQIEQMVAESLKDYYDALRMANSSRTISWSMPSIRYHRGGNLAVVIGEPEAVSVAAKVIGALPGVRRSASSNMNDNDDASRRSDDSNGRRQRDGAVPEPRQ